MIAAGAAVGGKKESEGPLAAEFDELSADNRFGQSNWEAAEKYLQLRAARLCLQKAALPQEKVQLALAGDLQAQCTASSYAMRELGVPFAGLFGACSTMAEGLALGAVLCEGGAARNLLAMASSHFCAAERQFRTPLSYGAVRTPTAQWTATAAGCCLLQPQGEGVGIAAATFGRVQDYQVKDINNMGAAMAPAAASTLLHYFKDTGTEPQEFDCIYTGDLGQVGSQLLRELLARVKANIRRNEMVSAAAGAAQTGGGERIEHGRIAIDPDLMVAYKDNQPLELTQREYELLKFLASQPGKVFSREALMEHVWNYEGYVGDVRAVDVAVRRLREKVEDDPASPQFVVTRRGLGYYFNA